MTLKRKVYLVGAGPGDINLITLRCINCLKQADVVVYDNLINPLLLEYTSPDCEKIYVGKKINNHSLSQDKINLLLVEKFCENKLVVRLKGGDPFVFGRGGEEASYLREKEVPFEIVPGISSSIAALSYAGIPITDRDLSSAFHVITGHEDPDKDEEKLNYEVLAKLNGTLVFMMGLTNIDKICEKLISHGKSPYTPCAIISRGTLPNQKVKTGTLGDIVRYSSEVDFPAIIVIGEVVRLRDRLLWFENLPLFGRRILVTRARHQSSKLSQAITENGGLSLEFPTIEIQENIDDNVFCKVISKINEYNWIIFTSVNAVEIFFNKFFAYNDDIRKIGSAKIVSIGTSTKSAIEKYNLKVEITPDEFLAEGILERLIPLLNTDDKILIPRADVARDILPNELQKVVKCVDLLALYKTEIPDHKDLELVDTLKKVDTITFTSSSTVNNFVKILGIENLNHIEQKRIACIGPITKQTAEKYGIKVDVMPKEYTIEALVDVL